MKILIIGYSGSGKSTLAKFIGNKYNLEILHLDKVQFLPNWEIRRQEEKEKIVSEFLDSHKSWVIDGNYSSLDLERRIKESDFIIIMMFNRIYCLYRILKRYMRYKGNNRPDMTIGCNEKMDFDFIKWILYKGRSRKKRERFLNIYLKNSEKTKILKNKKQVDEFIKFLD